MKSKEWYEAEVERLHQEGRVEGRLEGRQAVLLKQLTLKFGAPPDEVKRRVAEAEPEELERWVERILTADDVAAVFRD